MEELRDYIIVVKLDKYQEIKFHIECSESAVEELYSHLKVKYSYVAYRVASIPASANSGGG